MIRHFLIAIATAGFVLPMYLSAQCPTTTAPNPPFVPPAPYFANAYPSLGLLYGTASLWTWISTDPESWRGPACCRTQHPFVAKLAYTRARFDARKENDPELTIVATPCSKNGEKTIREPANNAVTQRKEVSKERTSATRSNRLKRNEA